MGVYTRFKKSGDGFRQLVELLESTPGSRRQHMIEVGLAEDPAYTQKAMQFMMTFEDIVGMPDLELAELLAKAVPRLVAIAIRSFPEEVKQRFLRNAKAPVAAEIRDYIGIEIGLREIGGAQMKIIETARNLEKRGLIKTKRIPVDGG